MSRLKNTLVLTPLTTMGICNIRVSRRVLRASPPVLSMCGLAN